MGRFDRDHYMHRSRMFGPDSDEGYYGARRDVGTSYSRIYGGTRDAERYQRHDDDWHDNRDFFPGRAQRERLSDHRHYYEDRERFMNRDDDDRYDSDRSYGNRYGNDYRRDYDDRYRSYGQPGYGQSGYRRDYDDDRDDDRGFFDRASDEVRSWFGDEDARRRRERDDRYDARYDRDDRPRYSRDDYNRYDRPRYDAERRRSSDRSMW